LNINEAMNLEPRGVLEGDWRFEKWTPIDVDDLSEPAKSLAKKITGPVKIREWQQTGDKRYAIFLQSGQGMTQLKKALGEPTGTDEWDMDKATVMFSPAGRNTYGTVTVVIK